MEKTAIPEGYQQVMPYLVLTGAEAFLQFTQTVFGFEEKSRRLREDGSIMHAEIRIGSCTIMFAESSDAFPPAPAQFFIYVPSSDAAYARALERGAESVMEPADQDYGRSCGVRDLQGNTWWITSVPGG